MSKFAKKYPEVRKEVRTNIGLPVATAIPAAMPVPAAVPYGKDTGYDKGKGYGKMPYAAPLNKVTPYYVNS